jgi:predicted ATPase
MIDAGEITRDERQVRIAAKLTRISKTLDGGMFDKVVAFREERSAYDEAIAAREKDDESGLPSEPAPPPRIPRGMFLHGSVGTGKSLLMNTFHSTAPLPDHLKVRTHFHVFMAEIHKKIHALKKRDLAEFGRSFHPDTSPERNVITRVALDYAKQTRLLCFDEFQVTDIADAVILKSLLTTLLSHGVVLVATSNRPIDDLYLGGINREYFLPVLGMLKAYCQEIDIASEIDYRESTAEQGEEGYLMFVNNDEAVRGWARQRANLSTATVVAGFGRSITIENASAAGDGTALFSFDDLCRTNLGANDYRSIASQFRNIGVTGVPTLTVKNHDEARRFITCIDEFYEAGVNLGMSCEKGIDSLFSHSDRGEDEESDEEEMADDYEIGSMKWMDVRQATGRTIGELASVRELRFAFKRARSRVIQMCGRRWRERERNSSINGLQ